MIIGHQKQWNFLVNSFKSGQWTSRTFLFSGLSKLGKKSVAIEFVKYINCLSVKSGLSKNGEPCHLCRNCKDIEKRIFPDFIFLEPEKKQNKKTKKLEYRKEIVISQIKELIEKMSLRNYSSEMKIAVIDKAHLMNQDAQNSFLKFLEEPKEGGNLIILITNHPDLLLPTIRSRALQIKFFPVSEEEIKKYLLNRGVSEENIKKFLFLSMGRPGKALDFYLDPDKLKYEEKIISDLKMIIKSDLPLRLKYADLIAGLPLTEIKKILDSWIVYFHSIFISYLQKKKEAEQEKNLLLKITAFMEQIQEMEFFLSFYNVNQKLALENLMLGIPSLPLIPFMR